MTSALPTRTSQNLSAIGLFSRRRRNGRPTAHGRRLFLEPLEDRRLLTSSLLLWPTGGNTAFTYDGHPPSMNSVDINQDAGQAGNADLNAMVVASHDGTVRAKDDGNEGYGKWVEIVGIVDGITTTTRYGHLHDFGPGIAPGTSITVNQGQIVGYVGTTGESTGEHLHYEVRQGSDVLDASDEGNLFSFYKGTISAGGIVPGALSSTWADAGETVSLDLYGFDWNEEVLVSIVDSAGQTVGAPVEIVTNTDKLQPTAIQLTAPAQAGQYQIVAVEQDIEPSSAYTPVTPSFQGQSVPFTLHVNPSPDSEPADETGPIVWVNREGPTQQLVCRNEACTPGMAYYTFTNAERAVIDEAVRLWNQVLVGLPGVSEIQVTFTGGSHGDQNVSDDRGTPDPTDDIQLSAKTIVPHPTFEPTFAEGLPRKADIIIDNNAGGRGWFVDPTPDQNEEFPTLVATHYLSGNPDQQVDLLSVALHELGHALGYSIYYSSFRNDVTPVGPYDGFCMGQDPVGLRTYTGDSTTVTLTTCPATHFDFASYSLDLMNDQDRDPETGQPGLAAGDRVLISDLDVAVLADAYGYQFVAPPRNDTQVGIRITELEAELEALRKQITEAATDAKRYAIEKRIEEIRNQIRDLKELAGEEPEGSPKTLHPETAQEPVLNLKNVSILPGQVVPLSDLISATPAPGDRIRYYEIVDSNRSVESGYRLKGSTRMPDSQSLLRLDNSFFVGGTRSIKDELFVTAFAGQPSDREELLITTVTPYDTWKPNDDATEAGARQLGVLGTEAVTFIDSIGPASVDAIDSFVFTMGPLGTLEIVISGHLADVTFAVYPIGYADPIATGTAPFGDISTASIALAIGTEYRFEIHANSSLSTPYTLTLVDPEPDYYLNMAALAEKAYARNITNDSIAKRLDQWQPALVLPVANEQQEAITFRDGDTLHYDFKADGFYRAGSESDGEEQFGPGKGVYKNAEAFVAARRVEGKLELAIAFTGTDPDNEQGVGDTNATKFYDMIDWFDLESHYAKFTPLIAAIRTYVQEHNVARVHVTGHSLGGAMAQMYVEEEAKRSEFSGIPMLGTTFGSPGSPNRASEENRIMHFVHTGDIVPSLGLNVARYNEHTERKCDPVLFRIHPPRCQDVTVVDDLRHFLPHVKDTFRAFVRASQGQLTFAEAVEKTLVKLRDGALPNLSETAEIALGWILQNRANARFSDSLYQSSGVVVWMDVPLGDGLFDNPALNGAAEHGMVDYYQSIESIFNTGLSFIRNTSKSLATASGKPGDAVFGNRDFYVWLGPGTTGTVGDTSRSVPEESRDYAIAGSGDDEITIFSKVGSAVYGGGGEDVLTGGIGVDYLFGHAGDDTLEGMGSVKGYLKDVGTDFLFGGTGNDTYQFASIPSSSVQVINEEGATDPNDILLIDRKILDHNLFPFFENYQHVVLLNDIRFWAEDGNLFVSVVDVLDSRSEAQIIQSSVETLHLLMTSGGDPITLDGDILDHFYSLADVTTKIQIARTDYPDAVSFAMGPAPVLGFDANGNPKLRPTAACYANGSCESIFYFDPVSLASRSSSVTYDSNAVTNTFDVERHGAEIIVTGNDAADQVSILLRGDTLLVSNRLTNQLISLDATEANTLSVSLGNGDDILVIDIPAGGLPVDVWYDGGDQATATGDVLELVGPGVGGGTYEPDPDEFGSGTIRLGEGTITFTGLEPVTVSGLPEFTFVAPESNDALVIDSDPGVAAPNNRISGTSGNTPFESITFFDVAHITIDMASNDSELDDPNDSLFIATNFVARGLQSFTVLAGIGDDQVNAAAVSSLGITINGGDGDDLLIGGGRADRIDGGRGRDVIDGRGGNDQLLGGDDADTFNGSAGDDTVDGGGGTDTYVFFGTAGDDLILVGAVGTDVTVTDIGSGKHDVVTGTEQINIDTGDSVAGGAPDTVTVRSLLGTDVQVVNILARAIDFNRDRLVVDGTDDDESIVLGEDPGSGELRVYGLGPAIIGHDFFLQDGDAVEVNGRGGNDTLRVDPTVSVDLLIELRGGDGNDRIEGGAGNDVLDGGNDNDTIIGGGGVDAVNGGGGGDTILVTGTDEGDTIVVHLNGTFLQTTDANGLTSYSDIATAGIERVLVEAGAGADDISVRPLGQISVHVAGGQPSVSFPGDRLTIIADGTTASYQASDAGDSGSFDFGANAPVSFEQIEGLSVNNVGEVTLTGTDGDDQITILGTGTDSILASINGGLPLPLAGITSLRIDAGAGDDDIDIELNDLAIPAFDVIGGVPGAESDTVTIRGENGVFDDPTFAPGDIDAGSFTTINGQVVNLQAVERVIYDGEGDGDFVTVSGTASQNSIVHEPGRSVDAGSVRVDSLLPLEYVGVGPAGAVTADGAGGTDTLTMLGTRGSDRMFVQFPAQNSVTAMLVRAEGTHLSVQSTNVENYRVETFEGDDVVSVAAPIEITGSLAVVGGGNGMAESDRLEVIGSNATPIRVDLAARQVLGLGGPISYAGIEHVAIEAETSDVRFDATPGNDRLAYTPTGPEAGMLQITGIDTDFSVTDVAVLDIDGLVGDDQLTVLATPADDLLTLTRRLATVGGLQSVAYSRFESIVMDGASGNDVLAVDNTDGLVTTPVTFSGSGGTNRLSLIGDTAVANSTYTPGPAHDEGSVVHALGAATQRVHLSDVGSAADLVDATTLMVLGNDAANQVTYELGSAADVGQLSVDAFPSLEFANKTDVTIDGLAGNDTISVAGTSAGFSGTLFVHGNEPNDADRLIVNGVDAKVAVDAAAGTIVGAGPALIDYATIESLYVNAGASSELEVAGSEDYTVLPGPASDQGTVLTPDLPISFDDFAAGDTISFVGTAGAGDRMLLAGREASDTLTASFPAQNSATVNLTSSSGSFATWKTSAVENYVFDGREGDDDINLTATVDVTGIVQVFGGGPGGGSDTLNLTGAGNNTVESVTIAPDGAQSDDQTVKGLSPKPIEVTGIEFITYAGVNVDDTLTVDPGSGDNAVRVERGTNGDWVISDSLPLIEFTKVKTFAVDAAVNGGADVVTFATRALGGAVPGNYQLAGGATDTLVIEGADGTADLYTATNPAGTPSVAVSDGTVTVTETAGALGRLQVNTLGGDDQLDVNNSTGLITLPSGIGFDGGAGSDLLRLLGSTVVTDSAYHVGPLADAGSVVHTAVAGTQTVFFRGLEPVIDIVAGPLTVHATDANNAIDYRLGPNSGGALVDEADSGLVSIDGFEDLEFANKTTLTVNALAGDDVVNLNNPTTPMGLTSIVVNGNDGDDRVTTRSGTPVNVTMNGDAGFDFLDASGLTGAAVATIEGGDGDDVLVGSSQIDTLRGGRGEDTIISGDGADFVDGGADFDVLVVSGTPGDNRILVFQTAPSSVIDAGYELQVLLDGNDLGNDVLAQTLAGVPPTAPGSAPTVEEVRIEAGRGNDLIQVGHADAYSDGDDGNGLPGQMVRFYVLGDAPNASDRLVVTDDGPGDLVLVRQSPDERSGRVTVAPDVNNGPGEVVYEGIERLDVTPHDPVTGGTGADGLGRIVVFQPDPFELNDDRLNPTDVQDVLSQHRDPTIDPGGVSDPFGWDDILGDEDWYEFRSPKIGTFRFDVLFTEIAQLANGREGLPGDGALDTAVYDAAGNLIVLGTPTAGGEQTTFSAAAGKNYYLRVRGATVPAINTYDVRLTEVDLVGPQLFDPDGMGPLSPVHITENTATTWAESVYDLFDPKPSAGPTPRVDSLTLHFRDLVSLDQLGRAPGDIYPALDALIAARDGRYAVVGDHSGRIAIASIAVTNNPLTFAPGTVQAGATATSFAGGAGLSPVDDFYTGQILLFAAADGGPLAGQARLVSDYAGATRTFTLASGFSAAPAAGATFQVLPMATASVELRFAAPLPDDRYTLTVGDTLLDPAGNLSDGENNAAEPQDHPQYPTGDGVAGGDFVARFTVDSRPEFGTVCCGGVYVDINGDFVFDPEGRLQDAVNRDLVFRFGETTDGLFAGNFAAAGAASASGFDKLGAYGYVTGKYRFLLDLDHDGVADFSSISGVQVNAIPVAGDFAAGHPGDEIGIFDGTRWHLDSDGDNVLEAADTTIDSQLRGLPVVGNFGGSSADDLATLDVNTNTVSFDLNRDGVVDDTLVFPLPGWVERILAGDVNLDGIDDLVFWVPGRDGQPADEAAEWYVLVSDRPGTGLPSFVFEAFSPAPLGNDLFALFGDQSALPIFGNFDPPVSGAGLPYIPHTNPVAAWDVNNDGMVTPVDALLLINQLNTSGTHPLVGSAMIVGPFYDPSGDGTLSPVDVLAVINWLNSQNGAAAEGESGATANMLGEGDTAWYPRAEYPGTGSGVTVDADRTGSASQAKLSAAAPADAERVSGLDSPVWAALRNEDTPAARRDRIRGAVLADVQAAELEQDWDSLLTMLADDFVR